jgi:hypothetical protein
MDAPSGPFTPWLEHRIIDGHCERCGIVPKFTHDDATKAYTHAGMILRKRPVTNIVPCTDRRQREDRPIGLT